MNEVLNTLNKNIQSLGRFVQAEDYRLQTLGLNGSLTEIYTDQVRALGELRKMFQTPSAYNGVLFWPLCDHPNCLREQFALAEEKVREELERLRQENQQLRDYQDTMTRRPE